MLTLIGIVLMLAVAYRGYRSARQALNGATRQEGVAVDGTALVPVSDNREQVAREPESSAEAKEAALSRQLLEGRIDRDGYQLPMTELATSNANRGGGAR